MSIKVRRLSTLMHQHYRNSRNNWGRKILLIIFFGQKIRIHLPQLGGLCRLSQSRVFVKICLRHRVQNTMRLPYHYPTIPGLEMGQTIINRTTNLFSQFI